MFCTAFNYISLRLLGEGAEVEVVSKARNWIHDHGGITSILSWGKTWLSVYIYYIRVSRVPNYSTFLSNVHIYI